MRSVHCWGQPHRSKMRGKDVEELRIAHVHSCGVTVPLSMINYLDAGLGIFAAKTLSKDDVVCPY